jgi:hypothetical protein
MHFLELKVYLGFNSRKVAGSRPDEVNFPIYIILPAAPGPGFTQPLREMSSRNRKIIMFLGSKVRPVRTADNLAPMCGPIV